MSLPVQTPSVTPLPQKDFCLSNNSSFESEWSFWNWFCLPHREYQSRVPRPTEPSGLRIVEKISNLNKF